MTREEIEKTLIDRLYNLITSALDGNTGQLLIDLADTKKQVLIIVTPLARPAEPNVFEATKREIN